MIFAGAILFYAATNLNSIIAERRQTILDKVSTALGRQVHADDIKVSLGWGILAELRECRWLTIPIFRKSRSSKRATSTPGCN